MLCKRMTATIAALAIAAGLSISATPAHAQWRGGYYGSPAGAVVGGALLGLGVGALLAPRYPPPPLVYAPPPYYPPPPPPYAYARPYYPAPGYYYYR